MIILLMPDSMYFPGKVYASSTDGMYTSLKIVIGSMHAQGHISCMCYMVYYNSYTFPIVDICKAIS